MLVNLDESKDKQLCCFNRHQLSDEKSGVWEHVCQPVDVLSFISSCCDCHFIFFNKVHQLEVSSVMKILTALLLKRREGRRRGSDDNLYHS